MLPHQCQILARNVSGKIVLVFLAAALFSACIEDSDAPIFDSRTRELMQASLNESIDRIGVPGATVTVVRPDGAKWVGVGGLSDIENDTAMAPGLKFRIGSLSKTFTATIILQLAIEERLSLDDTLDSFFPGLVPNGGEISVRQLLNHTSGLFDDAQAEDPNFLEEVRSDPLRKWTPEELISIANANGPYFSPGTDFHYSNTNYVLLGLIIEALTGREYGEEVTSRILNPLGLQNTSIPYTPEMPEGSTQGYTFESRWANTTSFDPSWAFGTGSIVSDSQDLLLVLDALMEATLLDPERRAEMFTFVDIGMPGYGYGLGIEKQQGEAVGHTGDFVYGGQAAMYDYMGWRFIVLVNASPTEDIDLFGSEYVMYRMMRTLGIW